MLQTLHEESIAHSGPTPAPGPEAAQPADDFAEVVMPLQIITEARLLSFISTTTVFGTPVDMTLQKLAVESFFPADAQTGAALAAMSI